MENHDDPIHNNKKGEKLATKNFKVKSVKAAASEKGRTYGIDCLNFSETVNESENDSVHEADNASVHNS